MSSLIALLYLPWFAPLAGVVTVCNVREGEQVRTGELLYRVEDPTSLIVYGELAAADAPGRDRELLQWVAADIGDGARFESPVQKEIHAHYLQQAVQIEILLIQRCFARFNFGHVQNVVDQFPGVPRCSRRAWHHDCGVRIFLSAIGWLRLRHAEPG